MRTLSIICGTIVLLIIGFLIWARISGEREFQETRPYVTYTRLIYTASWCDKYRDKYGVFPSSLEQLYSFQPKLSDWAKDTWGRDPVLVPYDKALGYGEVISYGRDGKPGGTGLDAELVVRFPSEANAAWNKQQGEGLKKPQRAP